MNDVRVQLPVLYVEGKNDLFVIANLMQEHGVRLDSKLGPVIIKAMDSVEQLLDIIPVAIKSAVGMKVPVGFVLDYDTKEKKRFDVLKHKFGEADCAITARDLTAQGIVKRVGDGRVGVWLMPYPRAGKGKLEDFLRELIPAKDASLLRAQNFVRDVSKNVPKSKRFRDIDIEKAEISAWLSVQDPPGNPYGTAIHAHAFSTDCPLAKLFAQWFMKLYGLSPVNAAEP